MNPSQEPSEGPMFTKRETFVRKVSQGLATLAGSLLIIIFLANVIQMGARPIMGGWIWINDLSRLLIIWVIMLGASAALGLREHLIVDFVVSKAPHKLRLMFMSFTRLMEILMGLVLLVSGTVVALARMNIQYIQLGIPTGYAYFAVPVLGFFMLLFGALMSIDTPESIDNVGLEVGDSQ